MTNEDARKVVAMVAAYFPSRLTPETVRAWAMELEAYETTDGIAGARRLGRTTPHPNLSTLIECVQFERTDRVRREQSNGSAHLQLVHTANPDPEQRLRSDIAREITMDIMFGRVSKDVDYATEIARRLSDARRRPTSEEKQ